MKIYLVCDGAYSDFHVVAAYSTMEMAEKAKILHNSPRDVEEFEIDVMPDHPPGMLRFFVDMKSDGTVMRQERTGLRDLVKDCEAIYKFSSGPAYGIRFHVWARDIQHAIKIANDRRAALVTTGEWARIIETDAISRQRRAEEREAWLKKMAVPSR